jgi:hypothetical protein
MIGAPFRDQLAVVLALIFFVGFVFVFAAWKVGWW